VDFIKADDMCSSPYHADEIAACDEARTKTGRPIVFSLSPGEHTDVRHAPHLKAHCEMWRISCDYWDTWDYTLREFDLCRNWAHHIGPGHWPDPDMLPLGMLRMNSEDPAERPCKLTRDEQRTVMTLWCIARAPLMLGSDLPSMDDFPRSLVTNEELLAVDQTSTHNRAMFQRRNTAAWAATDPESGDEFLALFNLDDTSAQDVGMNLDDLYVLNAGPARIRDLWAGKDLGEHHGVFAVTLPPHGAGLYRVTRIEDPGEYRI